jgi:uncharacterized iron-regulated membrane protein
MKIRRAIFWIHLASGCVAGAAILFLSVTGCILAYEKQIVAWQERGYHSAPPEAHPSSLSLDRLVEIATATTGRRWSTVVVQADVSAPVEIDLGREQRLFLNRYTGAVLGGGAIRLRAFFDMVTGLHRWFGASTENRPFMRTLQGSVDLALLLLIVSGVYLWLPKRLHWQALTAGAFLRPGLAGKARESNQHNVLGFWLAFPIAVIAITGAILAYGWATNLLFLATGSSLPPEPERTAIAARHRSHQDAEPLPPQTSAGLQQILENSERQAAGWRILRITRPNSEDRTMNVAIDFLDNSRPDQSVEMIFDRQTGAILKLNAFSSHSLGSKLRLFTRPIHTGSAGGLAGQTAAGITSLACCWLVWTGLSMSMRRFRGSAMFVRQVLRSESINLTTQTTPDVYAGSADSQLN